MEGGGVELKYHAIHVCKLRWNYGTSGEWGSEGLVNVVGNTVGTGRKKSVHWVSKMVQAMVRAAERRAGTQHEWQIVRKMKLRA